MKTEKELVEEIMRITSKIREEFPELSTHLLESPVKAGGNGGQTINQENLIDYRNSLNAIYYRFSEK